MRRWRNAHSAHLIALGGRGSGRYKPHRFLGAGLSLAPIRYTEIRWYQNGAQQGGPTLVSRLVKSTYEQVCFSIPRFEQPIPADFQR